MVDTGFIGLGDMGGPIAEHLVDAGHDVTVFDIDADAMSRLTDTGATPAEDASDVVSRSEVVFLSLPTPGAVEAVVGETFDAFEEGTVLADLTTSTPETTLAVEERLADQGVTVLGAPVSGGKSGAVDGTLSVMVGGNRPEFEACRPLFETFAANVFHIGESPGDGHAVKLLNNYLSFTALLATSEAVILGSAAGIDRETLVEVFNVSSGRNSATEDKFPEQILTEQFDTGFKLALMEKDARLFTEFGEDHEMPLLLGTTVRQLVGYAHSTEGSDADMTDVYNFLASVMQRE